MAICGKKNSGSAGEVNPVQQQIDIQSAAAGENYDFGNTISFPLFGNNQAKRLSKGVYQIKAFVDAGNKDPVSKSDFIREFEVDGEVKKVRFKRVSISAPENVDGKQLSKLNAVFSIDENPIPIAFLIWGAVGATGLTAGGYFVNQVNRFTESSFNQFLTIAGIGLTAYFALK